MGCKSESSASYKCSAECGQGRNSGMAGDKCPSTQQTQIKSTLNMHDFFHIFFKLKTIFEISGLITYPDGNYAKCPTRYRVLYKLHWLHGSSLICCQR